MTFIYFLTGRLNRGRGGSDASSEDDQTWYDCMDRCGINAETKASIMDPVFRGIRLNESCYFWMRDTIEMRYRGLEEVDRASQERERALQGNLSRPGQSNATSGEIGASSSRAQTSISSTIGISPGISQHTAMPETAILAAQDTTGSISLYKGLDQARLNGVFDDSGSVVNLSKLLSSSPSDFLGGQGGYYFTAHRDVAVHYACYAKLREPVNSVAIIHITIAKAAIESLSATELQEVYWPSTEWKTLVFHSRKGKRLPTQLRKFKEALLIIGIATCKPNHAYDRLSDVEQVTENMVLKTNEGNNAIQYVFINNEGEEFLAEHAAPNMKVFPVTTEEFRAWRRTHGGDFIRERG